MSYLKHFLLLFLLFASGNVFSQSTTYHPDRYNGALEHIFFGRQPSARTEAMGRELTAVIGEQSSYFYNPAGIGTLTGLSFTGSYAEPYYLATNAEYNFFGGAYKIKDYGVIGFSRDHYGLDVQYFNEFGEPDPSQDFTPYTSTYRLTLAREVIKDFYAGLNVSYLVDNLGPPVQFESTETGKIIMLDAGVIKNFNLKTSDKRVKHNFSLGSSIMNFTGSKIRYSDEGQKDALPVTLRLGGSYAFSFEGKWITDMFRSLDLLLHADYRRVLNADYLHAYSFGAEAILLEIFALRAGYFSEDNSSPRCLNCVDNISEFTYGFGLNLPLRKLTDDAVGVDIKIDVTTLPQPTRVTDITDWDNFELYTLKLSWQL